MELLEADVLNTSPNIYVPKVLCIQLANEMLVCTLVICNYNALWKYIKCSRISHNTANKQGCINSQFSFLLLLEFFVFP